MVLSFPKSKFSVLPQAENLKIYTVIVELPKLTVLYRIDLDKVIAIVTNPIALETCNVSVFKMSNCQINLQHRCGIADVELELFCRNLAGDSNTSIGYYPNSQIRLYQIRASKNGASSL